MSVDIQHSNDRPSVTVMGLGPMGKAMAKVFLESGYEVTVWNRTASKADELVAMGAIRASTITEAVTSNELLLLSLTDYDAMYAILEPVTDQLSGKIFVNLSSDSPSKVREASKWFSERGAQHLTGGVLTPPSGVGNAESVTLYSGPRETFESNRGILNVLTSTKYMGEDPGLSMLYYQIQIDVFWTAMSSYLHALAVARANGITAAQVLPFISDILSSLPKLLEFYTQRIDAGKHHGDVEKLSMSLASVEHVVRTSEDAGIDSSLPAAVLNIIKRGVADGHGNDSFTSLLEIFQKS